MKRILMLVIGFSLLLAACTSTAGIFSDPGKPVVVKSGDQFTLELASNVTTGYSWDYGTAPDPAFLKLVKTYYRNPKSSLAGAGGTQVWIFEAIKPGTTFINLEYKRPWEVNVPPAQTAVFKIDIH